MSLMNSWAGWTSWIIHHTAPKSWNANTVLCEAQRVAKQRGEKRCTVTSVWSVNMKLSPSMVCLHSCAVFCFGETKGRVRDTNREVADTGRHGGCQNWKITVIVQGGTVQEAKWQISDHSTQKKKTPVRWDRVDEDNLVVGLRGGQVLVSQRGEQTQGRMWGRRRLCGNKWTQIAQRITKLCGNSTKLKVKVC